MAITRVLKVYAEKLGDARIRIITLDRIRERAVPWHRDVAPALASFSYSAVLFGLIHLVSVH